MPNFNLDQEMTTKRERKCSYSGQIAFPIATRRYGSLININPFAFYELQRSGILGVFVINDGILAWKLLLRQPHNAFIINNVKNKSLEWFSIWNFMESLIVELTIRNYKFRHYTGKLKSLLILTTKLKMKLTFSQLTVNGTMLLLKGCNSIVATAAHYDYDS